jgi:hypothetical protein
MKTINSYVERFQATDVTVDSQWCEEDACQGKTGGKWHRIGFICNHTVSSICTPKVCVHLQQNMQYICCMSIHMRQSINWMTQIMRSDWILRTVTFTGCMLEKQATHSFCLMVNLGFISVDVWMFKSKKFPIFIHRESFHDIRIGVRCAVIAIRVIGPFSLLRLTLLWDMLLTQLFEHLSAYERMYAFPQQGIWVCTANSSMHGLRLVLDRIVFSKFFRF